MEFDEEIGYPGLEVQEDIGSSSEPAQQACTGQLGWPRTPRGQGHVGKHATRLAVYSGTEGTRGSAGMLL